MDPYLFLKFSADVAAETVDTLPTEFRIFKAGENESSKGSVIFDAQSASLVMGAAQQWGVDLMIDLEHDSLTPECRMMRADAADAMGWFRLELRAGELWAVGVRWTPPGCERLTQKRQRYISPAFRVDEQMRVVELLNVALVSMPATFGAAPLIAASKTAGAPALTRSTMDPKQLMAALDAIEAGDSTKAIELLKAIIASAASGGEAPEPAPGAEAMSEGADTPTPPEDQKLMSRLSAILGGGKTTHEVEAEVLRLSRVVATLEAERAATEQATRADLVAELVKLGVELPATAWADTEKRIPATRFAAEPVAELRARVEAHRAVGPRHVNLEAPTLTFSKAEQDAMAKMTPDQKARFIELRSTRKGR